ncbi:MAG: hypothetical protein ABIQ34_03260 [Tepidiformaceae bacterium]
MRTRILGVALGAALAAASIVPAVAAPGDSGSGFGGCVDNFYGNATNPRPSGNGVLPSQSPGPFVNTGFNEPPRNDRVMGPSMGDVMQFLTALGIHGQAAQTIVCTFP